MKTGRHAIGAKPFGATEVHKPLEDPDEDCAYEGLSWDTFVAAAIANAEDEGWLRCPVCKQDFELEVYGDQDGPLDNPFRLWQHLGSKAGEDGHPSSAVVARWDREWQAE